MQVTADGIATESARLLDRIRVEAPRVHCLTNAAAGNLTANMLLAAGAVPSLTDHPDELSGFVSSASALLVNLGTPDGARIAAVEQAIGAAIEAEVPWVLDPVMVERSPARLDWAKSCLAAKPTLVRLNLPEALALGLDHGVTPDAPVIALTGQVDRIIEATTAVEIANGHPSMARVTAIGCALSALMGAFLAVADDPFIGAVAATLCFGVAGEQAGDRAAGPGSFPAVLLDTLYSLDAAMILEKGRITCVS